MDLKLIGLIALGAISVWLRWSSPEQEKKRKEKQLQNLRSLLEKYRSRRNEILSQKRTDALARELAYTVKLIDGLRKKIRDLEGQ